MDLMATLYGALVVLAFGTFVVTLAVVSETTERHLKTQDGKSRRD